MDEFLHGEWRIMKSLGFREKVVLSWESCEFETAMPEAFHACNSTVHYTERWIKTSRLCEDLSILVIEYSRLQRT